MGYRQVIIKKADKLRLKDNQLVVINEEKENKVPLEDINFILIEDNQTVLTARLLAEISKYYIALIICDSKYEPASIMYSFNNHYKQLSVFQKQIQLSVELKEILWKQIITYKIANQIAVIEMTTQDETALNHLKEYISDIKPQDATNREGLAAKIYFRSVFGSEFIRFYNDAINASLNYGYTILKSAITRSLVSFGLNTFLGINHCSQTNNFNLCYDFIEPYRPLVDKYVYDNIENLSYPLSFESRKNILNILNKEVLIDNKHCTVQYSIDVLVKSYINSIEKNQNLLLLPSIIYD